MQKEHAHLEAELRDAVAPEHLAPLEQGIDAIIARLDALMSATQVKAEDDR